MTRRTDHTARAVVGRTGTGRQVALAASVALMAVTGTAAIAWSSLALAPGLSATTDATTAEVAAPAAQDTQEADSRRFAAATRALAATPVAATQAPTPVTLSTRSRDAQRLGNAVQPKLFGGAAAAAVTPAAPERTVDPANRSVRPVERPVAASSEPVSVAAAAPAPQVRVIPVPRVQTVAPQGTSRLSKIWSVGLFR